MDKAPELLTVKNAMNKTPLDCAGAPGPTGSGARSLQLGVLLPPFLVGTLPLLK